jgi:Predicted AAA-ATPase.
MGIYVNPGNTAFRKALNSDIYVDKTELISVTNARIDKSNCFMCVSRPRRFGKSMAADMLSAYYSRGCDSSLLFSGLKIKADSSFDEHLNSYNVIRLDIQQFLFHESHLDIFISKIQQEVINELQKEYSEYFKADQYGLPGVLKQIYAHTENGFIFIIDEWDCVFRLAKERKDVQKEYLDFLRGLFKGPDYVELAYMTGILPIKKYGDHSAINIFHEYSMISQKNLGKYFGFTDQEVKDLCTAHDMDYSAVEKWYDGYRLGEFHIYNPKSVVDALTWGENSKLLDRNRDL